METTYIKEFPGTPYSIEISTIENAPGTWNSTSISVCCEENKELKFLGKYIRNYPDHAKGTFYPFRAVDGNWYALYSANYTTTRVMRLHNDGIEDWCGETPAHNGFCPTEFYIPRHHTYHSSGGHGEDIDYYVMDNECSDDREFENESKTADYVSTDYCKFGFVSGCVWGDDISWKLRYIDLSAIPDRQLLITEKFGYWELPATPLKQCIGLKNWEPGRQWVEMARLERVNLDSK